MFNRGLKIRLEIYTEKVTCQRKMQVSASACFKAKRCYLPTNAPRGFHVETTWKQSFPRRFNVEYTWCVCSVPQYFCFNKK